MKMIGALLGLLMLPGCINIDTHLQPINQTVKAVLIGTDCTPIVFGFGAGTNRVEKAMVNKPLRLDDRFGPGSAVSITRIRSIAHERFRNASISRCCQRS